MRDDLTRYDIKPEGMINYLRYNGAHFSKKLAEFAVGRMRKGSQPLTPVTSEAVDNMLSAANISVENAQLYDKYYVANMAKADYFGSSIADELHLARFVKDYIDDEDGYDGIAFNRYLSDCARKGVVIDWENMI